MKLYTNTIKDLVDSNYIYNKEVTENTSFTQLKHNSDEGMLNNYSDSNELTVKNSSTLSLSKKKNTDDSKNKFKKSSNISDSDSSSSEDIEFPIKYLGHEHFFSKENENDKSNSDDEMHSKFRQSVSKRQNTNNFKIYCSTDESDSSCELSSNVLNINPINKSETENCYKTFGNNLLSDKKTFKKYNKRKEVNNKSTFSQLSNINKTDIDQILEKDSSSDVGLALINKISNEKQENEKVLNKNLGSTNITNTSSNDELFILNLLKSKKKILFSKQNNINLLVNEEDKKHKLINKILTVIKNKNKKQKQKLKLHVPQTTSYVSENRKDVLHLTIPIEDLKYSMPIYNFSQKRNSSKLNTKLSDDSIYDENYIIKKIMKERKLSKITKVDVEEQTTKKHKKSKYQKASMLDGLKNDVINKKREIPRGTKDFLIDSIIGALENSSSDHGSIKKKKPKV
ncbi:uncharacterized protein LOC132922786 [Rhopalosiphum padi]|uniref:uncharacterized protein LOC132922786 n=1 Tax=Rhopalosiphum padi TaxID=40932 RepID=UPI00298E9D00|nr:uncharacterized protein LOC132922786 [Rhopalosiphum padi]